MAGAIGTILNVLVGIVITDLVSIILLLVV